MFMLYRDYRTYLGRKSQTISFFSSSLCMIFSSLCICHHFLWQNETKFAAVGGSPQNWSFWYWCIYLWFDWLCLKSIIWRVRGMVFNACFNNISVILWRSEYPEKTTDHWQTLSHNVVSSTPRHERYSNSQFQL